MKIFINRIILLLLIVFTNNVFSQFSNIGDAESAEQSLAKQTYSQKIELYKQLIAFYSKSNLEKSIQLSEQMHSDAIEEKNLEHQAEALNFCGRSHIRSGNFEIAKEKHVKALLLYQKIDNLSGVAAQLGNLGVISEFTSKLPEALHFYHRALKIYQDLKDDLSISFVHNNIGIVYQTMGLFEPALSHQQKAYNIKKNLNDTAGMASTLNNIGVLYESLKEDFNQALFYYLQSLYLYESVDNQVQMGTLYNNIGLIYFKMNQLEKANDFYEKALSARKSIGDVFGVASTQLNIAQLKLKFQSLDDAIRLGINCLDVFVEAKSKLKIAETYQFLANAFEQKSDFKNAFLHHQKYSAYRDSLLNENNQKIIHEMQARFDNETNLQKLQLLEKDNVLKNKEIVYGKRLVFGLVFSGFAIALLVFLFVRQHQFRLKHRHLLAEQKLFRAQMNPHFIFNALASVQAFVLENDKESGSKYITRFARMMRKILDFSSKEFIPLSEEIDLLKEYVAFQKLRFNNSFDVVFQIDSDIEVDLLGVPPMMIQPFVENAIEHGIRELQEGRVDIVIKEMDNFLKIEIIDNGIGINKSKLNALPNKHYSKAIEITNERLSLFGSNKKRIKTVEIIDLSDFSNQKGTKVSFELPIKNV